MENSGATRRGIYLGETSRSLHERSVEHLRDSETFTAKSHIVKHWVNVHPEYLKNYLTRVTVAETDWGRKERERLEEDAEELECHRIEAFRLEIL